MPSPPSTAWSAWSRPATGRPNRPPAPRRGVASGSAAPRRSGPAPGHRVASVGSGERQLRARRDPPARVPAGGHPGVSRRRPAIAVRSFGRTGLPTAGEAVRHLRDGGGGPRVVLVRESRGDVADAVRTRRLGVVLSPRRAPGAVLPRGTELTGGACKLTRRRDVLGGPGYGRERRMSATAIAPVMPGSGSIPSGPISVASSHVPSARGRRWTWTTRPSTSIRQYSGTPAAA